MRSSPETMQTVSAHLRPIDREGLLAYAEKGRQNPSARGTNRVHTITEGQYRTLSHVGDHAPVAVDEPLHLLGQNTAPAPGESVRSRFMPLVIPTQKAQHPLTVSLSQ